MATRTSTTIVVGYELSDNFLLGFSAIVQKKNCFQMSCYAWLSRKDYNRDDSNSLNLYNADFATHGDGYVAWDFQFKKGFMSIRTSPLSQTDTL